MIILLELGHIYLLANSIDVTKQDYTGKNVTTNNVFAVLLGNKKALIGGSGKVLKSGPKDHVFLYYADHGGPGLLGTLFGLYLLFRQIFY